jgi:hypothetical protein
MQRSVRHSRTVLRRRSPWFVVLVFCTGLAAVIVAPASLGSATRRMGDGQPPSTYVQDWTRELNDAIYSEEQALRALGSELASGPGVAASDLGDSKGALLRVQGKVDLSTNIEEIDLGRDVQGAITDDNDALARIDHIETLGQSAADRASADAYREDATKLINAAIHDKNAALKEVEDFKTLATATTTTTAAPTTTAKAGTTPGTTTTANAIGVTGTGAAAIEVSVGGSLGPALKPPYGDDASTYTWSVLNAPAGQHTLVVHFTGPGLPSTLTFVVPAGGSYTKKFILNSCGVWVEKVVSVDGKPLGAAAQQTSSNTRSLSC